MGEAEIEQAVMRDLRASFRPEFLNRLDESVVFHRLDKKDLREIVDIQLRRFRARLADREISFEITDAAKDFLTEVGFDPTFGARPLKRAIQRHLENRLAEDILSGKFGAGDGVLVDRTLAGELTVRGVKPDASNETTASA